MRSFTSKRAATLAFCAATLSVVACDAGIVAPPRLPASELRAAPTSITLSGESLVLETYLYRDFMPLAPPNGRPLIAVLRIKTTDGSPVPSSVHADGAWVVLGDDVWATAVASERPRDPAAASFEVVARNGPRWGPGVSVDVVVRLRDGNEEHRLRAPNQPIHRTD